MNFLWFHTMTSLATCKIKRVRHREQIANDSIISHIDTFADDGELYEPCEPSRSIKEVRQSLNQRLDWGQSLNENHLTEGALNVQQNVSWADLLHSRFDLHKFKLPKFNHMRQHYLRNVFILLFCAPSVNYRVQIFEFQIKFSIFKIPLTLHPKCDFLSKASCILWIECPSRWIYSVHELKPDELKNMSFSRLKWR